MTVLSVPGGKGRGGPIEGEGPERATISTQNNVGPMTAQETMFFNRVKDWLGTGVNERVLMQVVKSNSMISTTNTSEGAMNDLVVAYLDRLQTENKAGKQAVDKCTSGGEYSSGNTIDHRIQTHVTETIQVKSKGTTNRIKAYSSTCLENREEQDNIPGFSPIAQSDPENPHERRRYELAPVGLKNMGNSCWFNVVSQTLYHIPKFRSKIFEVKTDFLSTRGSNPSANEPSSSTQPSITPQTLLITFRRLYALLLASERGYVDPSDVLSTISELNATLNKAVPSMGIQQDATEMLLRIIEWLEQALRIYETFCADMRSPTLPMEVEGQDEAMPLDENCDPTDPTTDKQRDCLNNNLVASPTESISNNNNNNNDNGQTLPFSSLFHGSHIEIRLSADGSITSSKLDNSLQMVNLDVSFDNLHDSLEAYHFADAPSKEVWFDSIPNVIIFSMVRFSYKNGQTEKLHNKFHFPMDFYMDRYMHRNRAVVLQRKKYRAALKQKLNSIRAQLNRMRNYPVGKVNASIPEILNALLSLKSTYFDNWLAVTVTVQSDEWTVPKNQCTADLKQLQRQCKLLCVAIRMLDRLVPYMTDDSQSTRDNGLLTLFVDFLLIYHAIRITSELAVSVLKTASVQKFEECALFLSNEYKAMIMRIRSMNCEASDKALSAILTVWANISAKSKDLFKVASFHQMLKEASEVEMSTVEMPAINANVNIQDPWPDLYELCSIMQKTMLLNRCDLSRIIQLLIEHLLNPLLSLSNNNEQTTSSLL
ncbi:unnamed protein product [Anisakis simplex]|uniref:Probable ubiquitin carboxyl-terminal hydrolase (inferred by orthology to a C. elegans protein) n=1 Tax=Anisakis simplex TaxID=6269 RepID=A0A158PNI1_ANISI|nr:unnamed protein product [Anisakis simplex]